MSDEEKTKLKELVDGMMPEQIVEIVKHIQSDIMFDELIRRDHEQSKVIHDISGTLKNFK